MFTFYLFRKKIEGKSRTFASTLCAVRSANEVASIEIQTLCERE